MGIDVSLIGTTETESEGSTKVWCGVSKVAVKSCQRSIYGPMQVH